MRKAAFAALLLLAGCTSKQDAYRDQIECVTVQDWAVRTYAEQPVVSEETERQAQRALQVYRQRMAERARSLGKSQKDIAADMRAFQNELEERSADAHGTEEYLERIMARCALTLES